MINHFDALFRACAAVIAPEHGAAVRESLQAILQAGQNVTYFVDC
jgi:hypothetical protein